MAKTVAQSVGELITIAVANQNQYIWSNLKILGYNTNKFIPAGSELEAGLYRLYADDKSQFYSLLRGLNFDSTKTNISTDGRLNQLATDNGFQASPSAKFDLKGIWDFVVETVAGKDTTTVSPTVITETKINIGAVIGLIVVAILAVVIVYIAFFRK